MKAILCAAPRELRLIDRDRPVAGPGQSLVRIRRVGICGTDLHIFAGNQPYFEYPRVIGHELAGAVESTGRNSGFTVGETVAVIPYLPCGHCRACAKGLTNCCRRLQVLGVHCDGGLAEFLVVPDDNLVAVGGLSVDAAAEIEFLAIGAHGIRRAGVAAGERVLVVGAGPIGISAVLFASLRGATVTVIDGRLDRLAFCRDTLGVANVLDLKEATRERLAALTEDDFFDVVIDATGSPKAMEAGFAHVGHGGRYVLLSIVQGPISFLDPEFHKRETTLLASRNATREDFDTVIGAIRAGLVPVEALNTHRAPLDAVPDRMAFWATPEAGVVKAIVEVAP
jgi:2-desacetyl-2-hydroxyethyl bacteriochlorophyllide A dehydrogenase